MSFKLWMNDLENYEIQFHCIQCILSFGLVKIYITLPYE